MSGSTPYVRTKNLRPKFRAPDGTEPVSFVQDEQDVSGTLQDIVDLANGSDLPVLDSIEIVKGSVDDTKRMRIEVDTNVSPGATRVLTMPDADIEPDDKTASRPPTAHSLGGAEHSADTLANLNSKVSDANLDDSGDPRTPTVHALGGAEHSADTLANLNSKVSDATLDDEAAGRIPKDHQEAASDGESSTTSTTFQLKTTLTTPSLTGKYRVAMSAEISIGNSTDHVQARLQNTTDATELVLIDHELEDPTNYVFAGGFAYVTFSGAAKTFEIQFRTTAFSTATIRRARIELWRISA